MHIRKSNVRSNQLDVQETNCISHSSTEFDVKSLDADLRIDGTSALDLGDFVIDATMPEAQGNLAPSRHRVKYVPKEEGRRKKQSNKSEGFGLTEFDYVMPNAKLSRHNALLYIFENNEVVIKMIIKGRSPTMRHVSRTHRVALDWLFDKIKLDPKIQIKYVDTRNQFADILTKGTFTRDGWRGCSTRRRNCRGVQGPTDSETGMKMYRQ